MRISYGGCEQNKIKALGYASIAHANSCCAAAGIMRAGAAAAQLCPHASLPTIQHFYSARAVLRGAIKH